MSIDTELEEEITIDIKKIFVALYSRKLLFIKVFFAVLAVFIVLSFVLPKKYKVTSDLYVSKTNNSNIAELNPFVLNELGGSGSGLVALTGGGNSLNNEIELIKSPLVLDKVIRDNDLKYKKMFGIFKTPKTGEYIKAEALAKNLEITNLKGTNVIEITYVCQDKDIAYGVVKSTINHYEELYRELNMNRAKSDKKVLSESYEREKKILDQKINASRGALPDTSLTGVGSINVMSAFSKAASDAIGRISSQYTENQKSRIELEEESSKLREIGEKLEYARLVEEMSKDASKLVILKEPKQLREFEYYSPKIFSNIILGIIFGLFAGLIAVIIVENSNKKLTYSMLGENVIYKDSKSSNKIKNLFLQYRKKKVLAVNFVAGGQLAQQLSSYKNVKLVEAEINEHLLDLIDETEGIVMIASVDKTDSETYKQIKEFVKSAKKEVYAEVLV